MIQTNSASDPRFGASAGPQEPADKNTHPTVPPIELAPFQQRFLLMRLEAMSKRYKHWRDLSRYINPKRGFFEGFVPNKNADHDYRLIIDDNPAAYARILAAGMSSHMTSPSRPWFKLGIAEPGFEDDEEVKLWLEDVERILYNIYGKSNFYDTAQQTYEELGLFGTGCFGIFEDFETVIRTRAYTIGEYFLSIDAKGRVNGFARPYWMTVDQLVEEFGWNNLSDLVKNYYKAGNRDQFILVNTLCEENKSRIPGYQDFKNMKYRSLTWEATAPDKQALRLAGHNEFPYMGPRWDTTTTADVYGNGPGSFALGNIKMLYRMQKDSLLAINKVADPPVMVDASVEGVANMLPGGVTRSSSVVPNTGVRPVYQVNPDINAIEQKIAMTKKDIASRFYADLFMMLINAPDDSDKTAREIAERHEEKLLMLGPVVGRIKSDMLDPAIDRTFECANRAGLIPPPPQKIQGMPLKVEYISLLAQAQKMVGTAAIEQEAAFVGTLAGAYPEAKDVFNVDEAIRAHAGMIGVSPKIINSPEQVQALRAARAQQMAAAQAKQDAASMVAGAKAMSETQVGAGNALEKVLGIEPSPAAPPGPGGIGAR